MSDYIPIVDFTPLSLQVADSEVNEANAKHVAQELLSAFCSVGFVYLKNTAISSAIIDQALSVSGEFFQLPVETKTQYRMRDATHAIHGWREVGQETNTQGDLKECFDVTLTETEPPRWPAEVPEFRKVMLDLYEMSARLAHRILFAIGLGMDQRDPTFLNRCHNLMTPSDKITSCLRVLFYPPVVADIKPEQHRLGAHTDFGTITLLYQDSSGGLEVRTKVNDWVEAVPIQDTVIVNIGDLLQRWTDDRLVSTEHRVRIPEDEGKMKAVRRSIAFFVQPDVGTIVSSLDGSNKYPPVSAEEFVKQRIIESFKY